MKSGVKVTADNADSVLAALKELSGMDVLVGIPEGNAPREDGKLNNAEIGYLQSTGATIQIDDAIVTLPPRPFLDIGIEDTRSRTTAHLKAAAGLVLEGNADGAQKELERAGIIASDGAKSVIEAGDRLAPLSEKTIKKRREAKPPIAGDKPLRARGYLLRSITYVVRKK